MDAASVFLSLPNLIECCRYVDLELNTDGGRLIGLCVGVDLKIQYALPRDSHSNYLLVIDRPGLLEFLSRARLEKRARCVHTWEEWESGITTMLPIENNLPWMTWAVFGRRIVINAVAETFPFAESAVEVANEYQAEDGGHKNSEDQRSEGQGDPDCRRRLIVIDFGCHRLASVVEAGDASGNIIRSRTQKSISLPAVRGTSSKKLPYRIWMERIPSRLPSGASGLVHMSESMILVLGVSC